MPRRTLLAYCGYGVDFGGAVVLVFFAMFHPAKAGGACVCGLQAGLYHSVCTLCMDVGCSCSFL